MRHISIQSRFTHCLVDDTHTAQGPSIVAEVILDGRVGHLERERAGEHLNAELTAEYRISADYGKGKHVNMAFMHFSFYCEFERAARKIKRAYGHFIHRWILWQTSSVQ